MEVTRDDMDRADRALGQNEGRLPEKGVEGVAAGIVHGASDAALPKRRRAGRLGEAG